MQRSEIYEVTTDQDGNWYELRKRELHFKRAPTWDEYDEGGFVMGRMRGSVPFWIGDFINKGEEAFGERASQATRHFGEREYQTVANYASVCRRVPARLGRKKHRRDELSFSSHEVVAKLDHDQQAYWLDLAVKDGLSSGELRKLIKADEEGDDTIGKSIYESLDDIIIDLTELKIASPAELRIHIDLALKALYDGRAEISKLHKRDKIPA